MSGAGAPSCTAGPTISSVPRIPLGGLAGGAVAKGGTLVGGGSASPPARRMCSRPRWARLLVGSSASACANAARCSVRSAATEASSNQACVLVGARASSACSTARAAARLPRSRARRAVSSSEASASGDNGDSGRSAMVLPFYRTKDRRRKTRCLPSSVLQSSAVLVRCYGTAFSTRKPWP